MQNWEQQGQLVHSPTLLPRIAILKFITTYPSNYTHPLNLIKTDVSTACTKFDRFEFIFLELGEGTTPTVLQLETNSRRKDHIAPQSHKARYHHVESAVANNVETPQGRDILGEPICVRSIIYIHSHSHPRRANPRLPG